MFSVLELCQITAIESFKQVEDHIYVLTIGHLEKGK